MRKFCPGRVLHPPPPFAYYRFSGAHANEGKHRFSWMSYFLLTVFVYYIFLVFILYGSCGFHLVIVCLNSTESLQQHEL